MEWRFFKKICHSKSFRESEYEITKLIQLQSCLLQAVFRNFLIKKLKMDKVHCVIIKYNFFIINLLFYLLIIFLFHFIN